MADGITMTNQELAKQLTTYADAITGFAWVQAIGFCFVMAKPEEVLHSILTYSGVIATSLGIVFGTIIYYLLTLRCMGWAEELERGGTASEADKTAPCPKAATESESRNEILRSIRKARLALIVLAGSLALLALALTKIGITLKPIPNG